METTALTLLYKALAAIREALIRDDETRDKLTRLMCEIEQHLNTSDK
jgi:hypothetical protein